MSLRIRRGTDAERQGLTFDLGEIVWTTDTQELWVGDGVTQGGVNPAYSLAGTNLVFNTETNKLDVTNLTTDAVAQGQNNKYFSNELAQAAVASLFANGTHTGITFTYSDSQNKIDATVTVSGSGGFRLSDDTAPELGGNLILNSKNITGTGSIDIIGNIDATGTIYAGGGLGGNLSLNGNNIIGTGNIQTTGTFWATQGLGGNLILNDYDITGTGNITLTGLLTVDTILANTGLAGDLYLNNFAVTGTGNINITGDVTASGTITGNLSGILTGSLSGDVTGDVLAADGVTVIVNSQTNTVGSPTTVFTGKSISGGTNPAEITSSNPSGASLKVFGVSGTSIQYSTHRLSSGNPVSTQPEDLLGTIGIYGYDGTAYKFGGGIGSQWEAGAVLTDLYPKSTTLIVAGAGASTPVIASLDSMGTFSAPAIKTGSYNGSMAYPSNATAGTIIFDSSNGHFYGYNGSMWKQLDN